ncbi:8479_t:CDS:2, partial [Cetraspora pellucida]
KKRNAVATVQESTTPEKCDDVVSNQNDDGSFEVSETICKEIDVPVTNVVTEVKKSEPWWKTALTTSYLNIAAPHHKKQWEDKHDKEPATEDKYIIDNVYKKVEKDHKKKADCTDIYLVDNITKKVEKDHKKIQSPDFSSSLATASNPSYLKIAVSKYRRKWKDKYNKVRGYFSKQIEDADADADDEYPPKAPCTLRRREEPPALLVDIGSGTTDKNGKNGRSPISPGETRLHNLSDDVDRPIGKFTGESHKAALMAISKNGKNGTTSRVPIEMKAHRSDLSSDVEKPIGKYTDNQITDSPEIEGRFETRITQYIDEHGVTHTRREHIFVPEVETTTTVHEENIYIESPDVHRSQTQIAPKKIEKDNEKEAVITVIQESASPEQHKEISSKQKDDGSIEIYDSVCKELHASKEEIIDTIKEKITNPKLKLLDLSSSLATAVNISYLKNAADKYEGDWVDKYNKARDYLSKQIGDANAEKELLDCADEYLQKSRGIVRKPHGIARIEIICAKNLKQVDSWFGGSASDPYVRISNIVTSWVYGDSRVIYNNCNPVWEQVFYIPVYDVNEKFNLQVYDYNAFFKDKLLGFYILDLKSIIKELPN